MPHEATQDPILKTRGKCTIFGGMDLKIHVVNRPAVPAATGKENLKDWAMRSCRQTILVYSIPVIIIQTEVSFHVPTAAPLPVTFEVGYIRIHTCNVRVRVHVCTFVRRGGTAGSAPRSTLCTSEVPNVPLLRNINMPPTHSTASTPGARTSCEYPCHARPPKATVGSSVHLPRT